MDSKEMAHLYIIWTLKTPEYYGKNLDALWDILTTYDKPIEIDFINTSDLIANLGDYGKSMIGVFQEAEKENDNIRFTYH